MARIRSSGKSSLWKPFNIVSNSPMAVVIIIKCGFLPFICSKGWANDVLFLPTELFAELEAAGYVSLTGQVESIFVGSRKFLDEGLSEVFDAIVKFFGAVGSSSSLIGHDSLCSPSSIDSSRFTVSLCSGCSMGPRVTRNERLVEVALIAALVIC